MRLFFSLFMVILLSSSAFAQDVAQDETYTQRLELAREMHEIWPTRIKVEKAIERVAKELPVSEQASFKAAMRRVVKYDQLEDASVNAMVKTFTREELQEMVRFYGSSTGRSISAKIEAYQAEVSPAFTQMMDRALMETRTGTAPGQMP